MIEMASETTRLAINGVAGRMGTAVRAASAEREDLRVILGISPTCEDSEQILDDRAGGETIPVVSRINRREALRRHEIDVVVDFSGPDGVAELAADCTVEDVALVSGTTGLDGETEAALGRASEAVPVLHATNFSRGIYALESALEAALGVLPGYDVEVLETHHRNKQDAPSGTAKTILETIGEHRDFETVHGREGVQPRTEDEVGMLVRRGGNVRGEHEIMLADNDEVLMLTHRAEDRQVFAAGALDAAVWLTGREAGWYTLDSVFESDSETDGEAHA